MSLSVTLYLWSRPLFLGCLFSVAVKLCFPLLSFPPLINLNDIPVLRQFYCSNNYPSPTPTFCFLFPHQPQVLRPRPSAGPPQGGALVIFSRLPVATPPGELFQLSKRTPHSTVRTKAIHTAGRIGHRAYWKLESVLCWDYGSQGTEFQAPAGTEMGGLAHACAYCTVFVYLL